jgi:hypothetical protein
MGALAVMVTEHSLKAEIGATRAPHLQLYPNLRVDSAAWLTVPRFP